LIELASIKHQNVFFAKGEEETKQKQTYAFVFSLTGGSWSMNSDCSPLDPLTTTAAGNNNNNNIGMASTSVSSQQSSKVRFPRNVANSLVVSKIFCIVIPIFISEN
jgi:hypothetical protein